MVLGTVTRIVASLLSGLLVLKVKSIVVSWPGTLLDEWMLAVSLAIYPSCWVCTVTEELYWVRSRFVWASMKTMSVKDFEGRKLGAFWTPWTRNTNGAPAAWSRRFSSTWPRTIRTLFSFIRLQARVVAFAAGPDAHVTPRGTTISWGNRIVNKSPVWIKVVDTICNVYEVMAPLVRFAIWTATLVNWRSSVIVTENFWSSKVSSMYLSLVSSVYMENRLSKSRILGFVSPEILNLKLEPTGEPLSPKPPLVHVMFTYGLDPSNEDPGLQSSPVSWPVSEIKKQFFSTFSALDILTPLSSSLDRTILNWPPRGTAC